MRAPRIVILAFFVASSLFLFGRALTSPAQARPATLPPTRSRPNRSVWGMMYYNTPFSLFPPNAAISLTDDNSTSFAARPAAFGPKLAEKGLSGQLWVGSGFAEDSIDGDGELGCSDLPGWDGSSNPMNSFRSVTLPRVTTANRVPSSADNEALLDRDTRESITKPKVARTHSPDDGTDDYLHQGYTRDSSSASPPHADIQSLQEAAEIEGKVVLLMRGGCGFLEKVMWAQRRGAVAVIVGDNQKGGPLIQMFAHGDDVDNVSIPSVFTARTTAQLLSALTQPGSFIEDLLDDNGNPIVNVQAGIQGRTNKEMESSAAKRHTESSHTVPRSPTLKESLVPKASRSTSKTTRSNWVARMFGWTQPARTSGDRTRSSSSGRLDWAPADGWSEDMTVTPDGDDDGFIIGVHDWRDSDLVEQWRNAKVSVERHDEGPSFFSKLFGTRNNKKETVNRDDDTVLDAYDHPDTPKTNPHDGLWVTITPTGSASPFFDTLLVLVVSPLITLTVVYALLLLRARIRRRRWRAPKSVVERLPVRTYHTVASTSTPTSRLPSPSNATPTTPLLQRDNSRSRPRSRTTTGVLESENLVLASSVVPVSRSRSRRRGRSEREKGSGGISTEWKKYMGRQVECVVCLEEYVDGVSRVMSLPCGHEFHEDCITPWLTTRRRTCPICKGDVVRSLARGSPSSPRYDAYQDGSDEEGEASGYRSSDIESDVEQGTSGSQDPRRHTRGNSWLDVLSGSLGSSRSRPRSQTPEDRNR